LNWHWFDQSRAAKVLELWTKKALYLVSRAEKIPELLPKALYFVIRAAKLLEFTNTKTIQTDCILFCWATKILGAYQQMQLKLTVYCSAVQRKSLEFVDKSNSYWLVRR
jgi:hypothetical protein